MWLRHPGRHTLTFELNETYQASAEVMLLPHGWREPKAVRTQLSPSPGTHLYTLALDVSAPGLEAETPGSLVLFLTREDSRRMLGFEVAMPEGGLPAMIQEDVRLIPGTYRLLLKERDRRFSAHALLDARADGRLEPASPTLELGVEQAATEDDEIIGSYFETVGRLAAAIDRAAASDDPDDLEVPLMLAAQLCGPASKDETSPLLTQIAAEMLKERLPVLRAAYESRSEATRMQAAFILMGLTEVDHQAGFRVVLGMEPVEAGLDDEAARREWVRRTLRGFESDQLHEVQRALLFCTLWTESGPLEESSHGTTLWRMLRNEDPAVRRRANDIINRLAGKEINLDQANIRRRFSGYRLRVLDVLFGTGAAPAAEEW
jgi:hypothetical protein